MTTTQYGRFEATIDSNFKTWRMAARMTREHCATLFEVDIRTVKNWESGKTRPPKAVFLCLAMYAGQLDFLGEHWQGFRLAPDGCIESPAGGHVWWYEVDSIRHLYQAAKIDRTQSTKEIRKRLGIRFEWET